MLFPFLLSLLAAAQLEKDKEYYGSTLVLQMISVEVWVKVIDSEHVDIRSSSPFDLNCEEEPFSIDDDGQVTLGDCFAESMQEANQTVKSLTYDATNDEIHLDLVKKVFGIEIPVAITLKAQ